MISCNKCKWFINIYSWIEIFLTVNIYLKDGEIMENKPMVFVIMPFSEDYMALYEELKIQFGDEFDFKNAGDLDNQQNILQDIVEGIYQSSVIIADLTGLNANVFYELGLAHAMNKKVIIITQDIGELPFDIKSYRANEYSLKFNKLPILIDELKKLLSGAIDNSVKYGNPVSDYILDFYDKKLIEQPITEKHYGTTNDIDKEVIDVSTSNELDGNTDKGYIDNIAEIECNSNKMTDEILCMGYEMNDMKNSICLTVNEMNNLKKHNGDIDTGYLKNACRKLAEPMDEFSQKLKDHVCKISSYWDVIENNYLSLLDNEYVKNINNIDSVKETMESLRGMQEAIYCSNSNIGGFVDVLRGSLGVERRLNKAVSMLIAELEKYLKMTDTMYASIDRISSKGKIVIDALEKSGSDDK